MKIFALLSLLVSLPIMASHYPESYRSQVLVSDKTTSTVTKTSFASIPAFVITANLKLIQEQKVNVFYTADWEKPYFTAWADSHENNRFSINFWGGLARIPGMNDEAFAITACHELGHVIGGDPKIKIKFFLWASSEGQSDYFATGVCMKNYLAFRHQIKPLTIPSDISETSFTLCRTTYSDEKDFLICLNTHKGIGGFRKMAEHLRWYEDSYSLDTPSNEIVSETLFDAYPENQCRLDTLVQGSLCSLKDFPCTGKKLGARPSCWFVN
jgi:hypothetical protein